jgi:hypothetical protein
VFAGACLVQQALFAMVGLLPDHLITLIDQGLYGPDTRTCQVQDGAGVIEPGGRIVLHLVGLPDGVSSQR